MFNFITILFKNKRPTMNRKIVLTFGVLFSILGITSCDECKGNKEYDSSEEIMNLVIGVHGVNGHPNNFSLIYSGIMGVLKRQGKTDEEIMKKIGFLPTGERIGNTTLMPIGDQVTDLINEIKTAFNNAPDDILAGKSLHLTFIGHSQGGPVSEETIKRLSQDEEWIMKYNIRGFKLCTLGSPMLGLNGSCDEIKILNTRLKEILKSKMKSGSSLEEFSTEDMDKFCDENFSENVLPSEPNSGPGLNDLSIDNRKNSSQPNCPVLYVATKCDGFKAFIEDWLFPTIMTKSLVDDTPKEKVDSTPHRKGENGLNPKTLLSDLNNMFSDSEKNEINEFWTKVLDNEENDGQVPLKSQYREGGDSETLFLDGVTHGGLLNNQEVVEKIAEFIFASK